MEKQKIIEILADIAERHYWRGWSDHAFDLEKDLMGPSSKMEAKWSCEAILSHINPSGDLAEIKSALGLPDDTPEPLVGVIWRLHQRIEALEEKVEVEVRED